MEFKVSINKPVDVVKAAFLDSDCKLMNKLLPFGCGILKFKGIRRRATISVYTWFFKTYHFKIAMCNSTDSLYYFHVINENNLPFGIKFWTNRYNIVKTKEGCEITNTIEYTSKNIALDKILSVFISMMFIMRKLKYKIFFLFKK
jgi:hypothetical protein